MTDLHDLKDALAAPPEFTAQPIDLGQVMAAGGRLRRRRRLAVAATSALAVLALLVGGAQLAGRAAPDRAAPIAGQPPQRYDGVLGDVVATGAGGWLIYAAPIDEPNLPGVTFGVCLGLPSPGGAPVTVLMSNATAGADRTPGFHAAEAAMQVDGKTTLTFGYYAGPAEVIVARTGQRSQQVTAHQAIWSEDPTVVFFWFDAGSGTVTDLEALDKNGRTLPRGDNQIGVG